MKVAMFYFSGTGNTWWVTNKLRQALEECGWNVTTHSIESIAPNAVAELVGSADVVGFGYPVYGSDVPPIMKDFMRRLPVVDAKTTLVYCTQFLWSGDGARAGGALIARFGYQVAWAEHFFMPSNVTVPIFPFPFYTNSRAVVGCFLRHAAGRVARMAANMLAGRCYRRGYNLVSLGLGAVQRIPYRRFIEPRRNDVSVDRGKCTSCQHCLSLCPMENLAWTSQGVSANGRCTFCLRCYNFCPVGAIKYYNLLPNPKHGSPYRGPESGVPIKELRGKTCRGSANDEGSLKD